MSRQPQPKKPLKKERLDVLLVERGLVSTRTKAQALIMAGQVRVAGNLVQKMGVQVYLDQPIELIAGPKYVSRGGEKIEGALEDLQISPKGWVCMDIGSSTGGFTDCLLQQGAVQVIAIDVGTAQLHSSLLNDPRVVVREETHILKVTKEEIPPTLQLAVMDMSFISLTRVLAHIKTLLPTGANLLAMVKPQFEVGAKFLKKGVVRSTEIQVAAVDGIIEFAKKAGFTYLGQAPARIKGPKGNQEYFIHLKS